jgi:hypothetical protein
MEKDPTYDAFLKGIDRAGDLAGRRLEGFIRAVVFWPECLPRLFQSKDPRYPEKLRQTLESVDAVIKPSDRHYALYVRFKIIFSVLNRKHSVELWQNLETQLPETSDQGRFSLGLVKKLYLFLSYCRNLAVAASDQQPSAPGKTPQGLTYGASSSNKTVSDGYFAIKDWLGQLLESRYQLKHTIELLEHIAFTQEMDTTALLVDHQNEKGYAVPFHLSIMSHITSDLEHLSAEIEQLSFDDRIIWGYPDQVSYDMKRAVRRGIEMAWDDKWRQAEKRFKGLVFARFDFKGCPIPETLEGASITAAAYLLAYCHFHYTGYHEEAHRYRAFTRRFAITGGDKEDPAISGLTLKLEAVRPRLKDDDIWYLVAPLQNRPQHGEAYPKKGTDGPYTETLGDQAKALIWFDGYQDLQRLINLALDHFKTHRELSERGERAASFATYYDQIETGLPIFYLEPEIYRNIPADTFVGHELKQIHQQVERSGCLLIHGFGGMGKTRLAVEYFRKYGRDRELFPAGAVWVNGSSNDQLMSDFVSLIEAKFPKALKQSLYQSWEEHQRNRPEEQQKNGSARRAFLFRQCLKTLAKVKGLLVIIDDLPSPKENVDYQSLKTVFNTLPPDTKPSSVRFLITSRSPFDNEMLPITEKRCLENFDKALSVEIIKRYASRQWTSEDDNALGQIAELVGHLPLALEIVGKKLSRAIYPATEALELLRSKGTVNYQLKGYTPTDHVACIRSTFCLGTTLQSPMTNAVLKSMVYLDFNALRFDLLQSITGLDTDELTEALAVIEDEGLIRKRDDQYYYTHRLIRDTLEDTFPPIGDEAKQKIQQVATFFCEDNYSVFWGITSCYFTKRFARKVYSDHEMDGMQRKADFMQAHLIRIGSICRDGCLLDADWIERQLKLGHQWTFAFGSELQIKRHISREGLCLMFCRAEIKRNHDIVKLAVQSQGEALEHACVRLRNKKQIVEVALENGPALKWAGESFRKDKEVVMKAVKYDRNALQYADESFRKDKDVVLAAVKNDGYALQYADESLRKDKEVVLAAVKNDGIALQYADESFRKDKEVVLAAVERNGYALQYADESFRKDKEVVLATVVDKDGWALQFADESLLKDANFVSTAIDQSFDSLRFAHESLKKNREFVLAAVMKHGMALIYADESFRKDKEVVLAAVKESGGALKYADESFRKDKEVVLAAVMKHGMALKYADVFLRKDKEVVLAALNENLIAFDYADELLFRCIGVRDIGVFLRAIKSHLWSWGYAEVLSTIGRFSFKLFLGMVIKRPKKI